MANDRDDLTRLRELDRMDELQKRSDASAPQEPGAQETAIPGTGKGGILGAIMDAAGGSSNAAARGFANKASLDNIQPPQMKDDEAAFPSSTAAGKGFGAAAAIAATGNPVTGIESGAGRIVASGATNGLAGFLQKPTGDDTLEARGKNGGLMGLLGMGGQVLGEGGAKAGDYLMQKAVDARKYIPGMGKRMADEGLIGTKSMMAKQVAQKLPEQEARLNSSISQLKGNVEPDGVADAIRSRATPYAPPGAQGPIPAPEGNAGFINSAHDRADAAMARGELSPQDALITSRAVAKPAYNPNTGDPLAPFKHELSQTEAGSLKDALKNMADEQKLPDVRDALAKEQALLTAKQGLVKPDSLTTPLLMQAGKSLGGAAIGQGIAPEGHRTEGALLGALLGTSAAKSTAAQALLKAAPLAPYLTAAITKKVSQ